MCADASPCFLCAITFSVSGKKKKTSFLRFLTTLVIPCVTSRRNYIICPSVCSFHLAVIWDPTVALGNIHFNTCLMSLDFFFFLDLCDSCLTPPSPPLPSLPLPPSPLVLSPLFTEMRSLTHCSRFSSVLKKLLCRCMLPNSQTTDHTSVLGCDFVNGAGEAFTDRDGLTIVGVLNKVVRCSTLKILHKMLKTSSWCGAADFSAK